MTKFNESYLDGHFMERFASVSVGGSFPGYNCHSHQGVTGLMEGSARVEQASGRPDLWSPRKSVPRRSAEVWIIIIT